MSNTERSQYRQKHNPKGMSCWICGSEENLQWHHIIPLSQGGKTERQNMLLLCGECHAKAHNQKSHKWGNHGRPKAQPPEGYKEILADYFSEKIGKKETCQRLCLSEKQSIHLTGFWWYKEYAEEIGVQKGFYNHIDILAAQKNKRPRTFTKMELSRSPVPKLP